MIISKTPLRISFAGGGSDLKSYYKHNYGSVISTAINKYVYIMINKRFSDNFRIGYSQVEEVKQLDEINHHLVREALKLVGGIEKGVDISYMADMFPAHEGSGLGSSSSLVVGTLNALHAFKGEYVSAEQLAKEACKIEIDILGHPIGKQDQYASAYGGFNHIKFNSDESVFVNPVIMKPELLDHLKKKLILFHTGICTRSDTVLTEQNKNIETKQEALENLTKMVKLSEDLLAELRAERINKIGEILHKGWEYKKQLSSNMSNDFIESYYRKAINAGAVGGKILGSGGGGFLMFYCEEENQDELRKELSDLRELPFNFEPEGSKIIYVH